MTAAFATSDLDRFRGSIIRRLGLRFDDTKAGFLADVLRRRLEATQKNADMYLAQLEAPAAIPEVVTLAQELTVAETYFFRHVEQYRAFAEVALPECLRRAQSAGARPVVVSAGCATGEEPYSLAITIRETVPDRADAVSILGVDINPALLEKAARGRFSSWVLRETPPMTQRRWFRAEGRDFVIDDSIRSAVSFEARNLAIDDPELWRPQSHDVVFCRNVLMYFAPDRAQAAIDRIARSLRPGGYLFLGHAETLRGLSNDFHLRHTHGTFYYQRKERQEVGPDTASVASMRVAPAADAASLDDWARGADTWIDTIQRASARIRSLTEAPSQAGSRGDAPRFRRTRPAREIGLALDLLREERFNEALEVVQALPTPPEGDAEVLLLRAVLLTHSGQLAVAEQVCERLLTRNELNAEAHYLLALCREGAGDPTRAFYHDQVAVYLEPSFAMAHLHMGLLARRSHDLTVARRELEQAIALLEREDPARLLLFGGGFTRDALIGLCRSELLRSGGHS